MGAWLLDDTLGPGLNCVVTTPLGQVVTITDITSIGRYENGAAVRFQTGIGEIETVPADSHFVFSGLPIDGLPNTF